VNLRTSAPTHCTWPEVAVHNAGPPLSSHADGTLSNERAGPLDWIQRTGPRYFVLTRRIQRLMPAVSLFYLLRRGVESDFVRAVYGLYANFLGQWLVVVSFQLLLSFFLAGDEPDVVVHGRRLSF
jgi:hypothetical protein